MDKCICIKSHNLNNCHYYTNRYFSEEICKGDIYEILYKGETTYLKGNNQLLYTYREFKEYFVNTKEYRELQLNKILNE